MKLILQVLIGLSATAAPQAPLNAPLTGPIVQASSPVFARQMALWEDSQIRLEMLGFELDAILEDLIEVESEDARVLDPLLVELYVRKADLEEIVQVSVDGYRQGLIRSKNDLENLQSILDSEIDSLERAVQTLRGALDEYLTVVIEV